MMSSPAIERSGENAQQGSQGVQVKRQVTVKTKVTDTFRERAKAELDNELKLIDTQLQQLEAQYQYSLQQLEKVAQQGQNVQAQLQQLNGEAQQKRSQLASVKMQVSSEMGNIDGVQNGQYIVTGMLEEVVHVNIGDNLYQKMQGAEILIEDGIVTHISA